MTRVLKPDEMAAPGSETWRSTITASKIPAMLGLSPWQSPFSLWYEMAGTITPEPLEGEHLAWGHDVEESLVRWWLRHNPGWQTNAGEIAYTNPDLPFPNQVTLDRRARRGRRFHILECKTARDLDTWGKPGEPDSVPAHYTAQTVFQMGVTGIHHCDVIVLGYGTPEIHPIQWDPDLYAGIVTFAEDWWHSLQTGEPPALDDTVATYDTVRGLHPDIDKGTEIQIDHEHAERLIQQSQAAEQAEADLRAAKTHALHHMGTTHRLMHGDVKIADRRARGTGTPYLQINKKAEL